MTSDASTWRSAAAYEHLETLTASDLAWEWLRRNEDYRADFKALMADRDNPDQWLDRIRRRWGLRFRCRPADPGTRSPGLLAPA